ncbi:MAG: Fic family protein [Streptococcaceae bacterium]|jgi:prophage maintenance system killer protein|nr:Fic family protein [Streptococcaceae bacterium]
MVDNTKLAHFITSLGSLNDYGSTVLQTKQALETGTTTPLNQEGEDVAIFQDALKGIHAIEKIGFSVAGIIAINQAFDTPSPEQPTLPGYLRNAYHNEADRIAVIIGKNASQGYFPPEVITRDDLQQIVDTFHHLPQDQTDAWRLFARLAKLQPFQDGNKRTALIAANAAIGALKTQDYLLVPDNDLDRLDFTTSLMRYYMASTEEEEEEAFDRLLTFTARTSSEPRVDERISYQLEISRLKPEIRKAKQHLDPRQRLVSS